MGGQELRKGLLRLGEVKVLSKLTLPHHLCQGDHPTTGAIGDQIPRAQQGASKCKSKWKERVSHGVLGGREAGPSAHTLVGICRPIARG